MVAHEVWTTNPGVSLSRSGGENATSIQLEELNLFPRWASTWRRPTPYDVDRSSYTLRWRDRPGLGQPVAERAGTARQRRRHSAESVTVRTAVLCTRYALERWARNMPPGRHRRARSIGAGEIVAGYVHEPARERRKSVMDGHVGLQDGWTRRTTANGMTSEHESAEFTPAPG